jgi:GNAT superfamily N-acetyltransferase
MNKLIDIRLKGSYLICHIDGKKTFFLLPQGLVQKDKGIDFFLDGDTLIAKLNGEESQILPIVSWKVCTNKGISLDIRVARRFSEICAGKRLLMSHYMGLPSRGLIINAYMDGNEEPVACGCLDRLYYAKPIGRTKIAEVAGRDDLLDNWSATSRADLVDQLRIAWISRLVVDKGHRNMGIATAMADTMCKIAREGMLPHADFIEVFMSFAADEVQNFTEDKNFYCRVGFKQYEKILKSSQIVFPAREDEGYITTKKIYCYRDLRDMK